KQAYARAPHRSEMLSLVEEVYSAQHETIGDLGKASMMTVCRYYGLDRGRRFLPIEALNVPGASSQRVFDIVRKLDGTHYITGLGAAKYLDHELFEQAGIRVGYMDYRKQPYPQLHGEFTPY